MLPNAGAKTLHLVPVHPGSNPDWAGSVITHHRPEAGRTVSRTQACALPGVAGTSTPSSSRSAPQPQPPSPGASQRHPAGRPARPGKLALSPRGLCTWHCKSALCESSASSQGPWPLLLTPGWAHTPPAPALPWSPHPLASLSLPSTEQPQETRDQSSPCPARSSRPRGC